MAVKEKKKAAPPAGKKIGREDFVNRLTAVQPGLASRDIVEQSTSFVFHNGMVKTFNEELYCECPSGLPKDLSGAVVAKPLMNVLSKMDDEFMEVDTADPRKLVLKAGPRTLKLAMDPDIRLPLDKVEAPGEWKPLPGSFLDALLLTHDCAGRDEDEFVLTCVHMTDEYMEASDTAQVARYRLKSGIAKGKPVLARRRAVTALPTIDLSHLSQTDKWLHLRNGDGLRVAVQNHAGEYTYPTQKAAFFLEGAGKPIELPKSLVRALDRAAVISAENPDADYVHMELRPGKGLRVKGVAGDSLYAEVKKVKYDGPQLAFAVSPKLMQRIVKEYTSCQITKDKLIVDGDQFRYCAALEDIPAPTPAGGE